MFLPETDLASDHNVVFRPKHRTALSLPWNLQRSNVDTKRGARSSAVLTRIPGLRWEEGLERGKKRKEAVRVSCGVQGLLRPPQVKVLATQW